jgi:hypothetical protein
VAIALALLGAGSAQALTLEEVGGGFEDPIYVTSAPGNPDRLLVVERRGTIQAVENGAVTTFADIGTAVSCCTGERGLQSIALAPDFAATGRFYVAYTGEEEPGEIHIAEMQTPGGPLRNMLTIPHPTEANHIGGQLQFGPDGDLYISTGDGGGSNDPFQNAQDLESPLGKILRIEPDPGGAAPYYTVPADNPFAADGYPAETIWAYGLRNPFRFSFDRLSGDLVIGDVGQAQREEIDFAPSPAAGVVGGGGANYGWNCREGLLGGLGTPSPECALAPADAFAEPVFDYPHTPDPDLGGSGRCAVIGGYVVRDAALGSLYGRYVYTDLCAGVLRSLQLPAVNGPASGDCSLGLSLDSPVRDRAGRNRVPPRRLAAGVMSGAAATGAGAAGSPAAAEVKLDRHQGAAAAGRTRQGGAVDRLRLPLRRAPRPVGRAPAQRPPQRIQVPQPRLHRPLPAADPRRHDLRRHDQGRARLRARQVTPADDSPGASPAAPPVQLALGFGPGSGPTADQRLSRNPSSRHRASESADP